MPRVIDRQTRAAYYLFLPYILLFLLLVWSGYFMTLRTHLGHLSSLVVALLAITVTALIYWLPVRHAADTLHATFRGGWRAFGKWIAIFVAVFVCSGLSLVTVGVFEIQGPLILQGDIHEMIDAFGSLRNAGSFALSNNDFTVLQGAVEAKRAALMGEIDKTLPGPHCGVGTAARKIIEEFKTILPDVRFVEGTDATHDCADRRVIAGIRKIYNDQIDASLRNSPAYRASNLERRDRFAKMLDQITKAGITSLDRAYSQLNGWLPFLSDPSVYEQTLALVRAKKDEYEHLRAELTDLVGTPLERIPVRLDLSASESIGTAVGLPHLVASSSKPTQFVVYGIGALVLDALAAYLGAAVIMVGIAEFTPLPPRWNSDVTYLWVPADPDEH